MKKPLSLLSVNVLYLVSMLLVVTLGSIVQYLDLSWGLIATEVLLIMLPALLLLRGRKLPLKEGLRLNPIPPATVVLCLLLGLSAYPFSSLIDAIMQQLTGMPSVPLPEEALPQGIVESILYFIAIAVSAPVCEEILFRGAIQGAYEKNRPAAFAILISGTMFAFYHFRLTGLPALLPIAFILGYAAWRTRSIYASMLVHFGLNATSAAVTLAALSGNMTGLQLVTPWTALAGLLVTVFVILAIRRLHPAPGRPEEAAVEAVPHRAWFGKYWPLFVAGLLYLAVAGLTLAATYFSPSDLEFNPPRIEEAHESRYQAANRLGQEVGELACIVTPLGTKVSLDCSSSIQGYEFELASSYFKDVDHTAAWRAAWDATTFTPLEYSFEKKNADGSGYSVVMKDGKLVTTVPAGTGQAELPENFLIEYEWAWRVNALDAGPDTVLRVPFGCLLRWDEDLKKSAPAFEAEILQVDPVEALDLPAGRFEAWKVTVGNQAAWYARDDPDNPRPVQFDDGMLIYSLEK